MAIEPRRLGTRIKKARSRKRWTQQELADALGVNIKSVDNWENGRTSPRSAIGALEQVLDVARLTAAHHELDDDESEPAPPPLSDREVIEGMREDIARLTAALRRQAVEWKRGDDDGQADSRVRAV